MKNQRKNLSLMTRATILLMILILPFNIIGITTALIAYQRSIDRTEDAIAYTLDSYSNLLNVQIRNTHTIFYDLTHYNSSLRAMCRDNIDTQYTLDRRIFFVDLNDLISISNVADTFFVYLEKNEDYIQIPGYSATTVGTKPYLKYITEYDRRYSSWFLSEDGTELIRVMYDSSLKIYYGAAIDLTAFLSQLDEIDGYSTLAFSFHDTEQSSTHSFVCFNSPVTDSVYLSASIATQELNFSISLVQYALILFFIIYLALLPVLIYLMKRYVARPLGNLNTAHNELQQGNEDYRILMEANSAEFGAAYNSFNTMATSLQTLHHEVMEKELSNKQLQIDFLQLQIRPHFLLNSFNVLYTLIQNGQRENSQDMVLFLSDYFRYLFRSGRELQLFSKERKLIEDYMTISKISYPVSFEVSYQIDPILDLMRIPPLLLHSFMENIIAHALLPDRQVHIVFYGEYDDGIVTFYISDDGKGMEETARESINHIDERPLDDGKNVGIKNSIRRLKYYYGEDATVECDSELGIGTTFIITIPYDLDEA